MNIGKVLLFTSLICTMILCPSLDCRSQLKAEEGAAHQKRNYKRLAGGLLLGAGFVAAGAGTAYAFDLYKSSRSSSLRGNDGDTMFDSDVFEPVPISPDAWGPTKFMTVFDRIINGEDVAVNQYKFFVMPIIREEEGDLWQGCGASLIADNVVLTAAHCLDENVPNAVLVGALNPWDSNNSGQIRVGMNVVETVIHPGYKPDTNEHDIALLKLDATIGDKIVAWYGDERLRETIKPIELANITYFDDMLERDPVTVMGFGLTGSEGSSERLQTTKLDYISTSACKNIFNGINLITDDMVCATGNGITSACFGDSGGPLIDEATGGAPIQLGVVSWGRGCLGNFPGVYAKPANDLDWIKREACPHLAQAANANDYGYLCSDRPSANPQEDPSADPAECRDKEGKFEYVDSKGKVKEKECKKIKEKDCEASELVRQNCPETCELCSEGQDPVDDPTPSPSEDENPDVNPQCKDLEGKFEFVDSKGKVKEKECNKIKQKDCDFSDIVRANCPETCDSCPDPEKSCEQICPGSEQGFPLTACSQDILGHLTCNYAGARNGVCCSCPSDDQVGEYEFSSKSCDTQVSFCETECHYAMDVDVDCNELCLDESSGNGLSSCSLDIDQKLLTCTYDADDVCACPTDDEIGNGFEFSNKRCGIPTQSGDYQNSCRYQIYN